METIERTRESWELTTEPIRPCAADLVHMSRQIAKRFARPRVLILGMTPELVDMAYEAGASRVAVIELRSLGLAAYKALARQGFEAINGDWRDFHPQCEGAFDIVLGHGPFIFLAFPEDWSKTLAVVRRYLVPGGALIVRHFLVPPQGFPFAPNYDRLVAEFDARAGDAEGDARIAEFMRMVTILRASAILGATRPDGVVDQAELDRIMASIQSGLERRYGSEPAWDLMRDEFGFPTAAGYGSVRPLAAPRLDQVRPVLEAAGLRVTDVTMIGEQPLPGCFCFITGEFA